MLQGGFQFSELFHKLVHLLLHVLELGFINFPLKFLIPMEDIGASIVPIGNLL